MLPGGFERLRFPEKHRRANQSANGKQSIHSSGEEMSKDRRQHPQASTWYYHTINCIPYIASHVFAVYRSSTTQPDSVQNGNGEQKRQQEQLCHWRNYRTGSAFSKELLFYSQSSNPSGNQSPYQRTAGRVRRTAVQSTAIERKTSPVD